MKENVTIEDIRKVKNPVVIKLRITNIDPRFDYATYLFRVTKEMKVKLANKEERNFTKYLTITEDILEKDLIYPEAYDETLRLLNEIKSEAIDLYKRAILSEEFPIIPSNKLDKLFEEAKILREKARKIIINACINPEDFRKELLEKYPNMTQSYINMIVDIAKGKINQGLGFFIQFEACIGFFIQKDDDIETIRDKVVESLVAYSYQLPY